MFPRAIIILTLAGALAACGTPGAPLPPSLNLPRPVDNLRAVRKGDRVTLVWTPSRESTDHQTMKPGQLGVTRICRSLQFPMNDCEQPVGVLQPQQIPASTQAGFADTLPPELTRQHPTAFATYAIEQQNSRGRSAGLSKAVRVPLVPTLPPPPDFAVRLTPEGVLLSWRSELYTHETADMRQWYSIWHHYRLYRRTADAANAGSVIGEVELTTEARGEFLDRVAEWQQTYEYRIAVVTSWLSAGGERLEIEGDDTPALRVEVKDTFAPTTPQGLQAVFSGSFIDLNWSPVTDEDLAGYNVYRSESASYQGMDDRTAWHKINPELVKTPTFRDANVVAGRRMFYRVTAVDLRGNEGTPSEEGSETVPQ